MEKGLQIPKEGLKMKIQLDSLKLTLRKYQTGQLQALMAYMDSDFKIHFHPRQTG